MTYTRRLRVFVLLDRIRVGALPRTSPVACGVAVAERALIHVHVHSQLFLVMLVPCTYSTCIISTTYRYRIEH